MAAVEFCLRLRLAADHKRSPGWLLESFVVLVVLGVVVPRRRDSAAPRVVHRTARVALRVTSGQRRRCFGLLRSAGDVWACVLEVNGCGVAAAMRR
ncbi:hypothetical protein ACGFIY_16860 [Micromonospora chersina]|uniref:hypothetical protein n=1 Tax=Micromonospora chersina TaxID=47854 RepID=UPI00371ABADA